MVRVSSWTVKSFPKDAESSPERNTVVLPDSGVGVTHQGCGAFSGYASRGAFSGWRAVSGANSKKLSRGAFSDWRVACRQWCQLKEAVVSQVVPIQGSQVDQCVRSCVTEVSGYLSNVVSSLGNHLSRSSG